MKQPARDMRAGAAACLAGGLMVALFASAPPASAEDWPTYQHDNSRSGASAEELKLPLKEIWKRSSPSRPQPAWEGPARWDAFHGMRGGIPSMREFDPAFFVTAVGDRVTFGSSADDSVCCLDASSGKEVWSYTTDGPVRLPPTWFDGKVYFGSDDGNIYCLQADTGRLVWKYRPADSDRTIASNGKVISTWPCRTGVLIKEGKAYFVASLLPWEPSYLCAVDARTGRDKGPGLYKLVLQEAMAQGALLATKDRLFIMQGPLTPVAVNLADGQGLAAMQKSKRYGGVYAMISPDNKLMYGYGPKDYTIFVHDANTRAMVGTHRNTTHMVFSTRFQAMHSRGELACTEVGGGDQGGKTWKIKTPAPHALALAGNVLLAGFDGNVTAYDAGTGKDIWKAPVSGKAYGLAVANGRLFVSTDDGSIHCFAGR